MDKVLPNLRRGLDVMPSPLEDRPGFLFRDPLRYSDQILIIPPVLAAALSFFDGASTMLDAQAYLTRLTGQLVPLEIIQSLVDALQKHGFLDDETFERMRAQRHGDFARLKERLPAHSGTGYPAAEAELRKELDKYLESSPAPAENPIIGLAAPHVSPWGGWQSYAAAYGRLNKDAIRVAKGKTIVLLGTSHYGEPEKFGLTRKPFVTPLGKLEPDYEMIDRIYQAAPDSINMEDYCHSFEHSIEFQCIFLQQMLGNDFKILPILCGPFAKALLSGQMPEQDDKVMRFFDALAETAEEKIDDLFWVLGIDLAHIGKRYGDDFQARAEEDEMLEVRAEDEERLRLVCEGRSSEFFEMVKPEADRLKWCGFSPLYTFMSVMPQARAEILKYEQWNIDENSVVSFAALEFS